MNKSKTKIKKKNAKIINKLLKVLMIVMILVVIAFCFNIYRISQKGSTDGTIEPVKNEMSNEYYTIGNNATELNKKYFKELTKALESKDDNEIASALVKCFITEYYTWTNKDGNYDIGGIQYIFSDRQSDFANYTRNSYYADMDLYISQLGSNKLMEVTDVEINSVSNSDDMTVLNSNGEEVTYPCITVSASWTYGDCSMDLSEAQTYGTFAVVNHDGRMEIASIE